VNGSWDIYSQRVGGRNATAIISDPQRNEGGPAYSPDGASIAFHEADADGGIFIAGATGESVRRVTDIGFHPAWSPNGKDIAFTTEEIADPASRLGESTLYVVSAAGGTPGKSLTVTRHTFVGAVRRPHRLLEQHGRPARHLHRGGSRRKARGRHRRRAA
jgi:Tol biopolymer transport system component